MKFSLRAARQHNRPGEYGLAVANYLAVLKMVPANAGALESEFLNCLQRFVLHMEIAKEIEEISGYFTLISEVYPSSPRFLTMWGQFLSRQSLHEEAALCFMKSLDVQPDYGEAKQSLRNLRYGLVDQWHFRMLNDRQRNAAYEQALSICLAQARLPTPVRVLDIGAGTGILSMLSLEAGAQKVYACEYSPIMFQMAKKILAENGFGTMDEVVLIEKHSKDLKLMEDLDGDRVHLIITELMDAGFYGEGIVSTVMDAKTRLLIPEKGLVIPSKAKIWACLIECEAIRKSNSVIRSRPSNSEVDQISDKSSGSPITIISSLCSYSNVTGESASSDTASKREPYTSAMLTKLKGGFRFVSQPFIIDQIDLNNEEDLRRHQNGISTSITTTITESCYLDAIACWFEADLLPESISKTKISICSKPGSAHSAWEQAIFPVAFTDLRRQVGETVPIDIVVLDDWLQVSIGSSVVDGQNSAISASGQSEDQSTITVDSSNASPIMTSTSDCPITNVIVSDQSLIELINDDYLFDFYSRYMAVEPIGTGSILDLTGNPRLITAAALQRRVFSVSSSSDAASITKTFAKSVDPSNLIMASSIEDLEQQKKDVNFEAVVFCPIETYGLLKQNMLEEMAFCRVRFGISKVIPASIDIFGMLIESEELERYARVVSDQNTLGLKIKNVINLFETDIHRDLELSTLDHKKLSEPVKLMTLNFEKPLTNRNRLPIFLDQSIKVSVESVEAGNVHAMVFWYELTGTGQERLSTLDPRAHFRVAAALTNGLVVEKNDLITVQARLERSELYFDFSLVCLADL